MIKPYKNRRSAEKILGTYNELLKQWDTIIEERDIETTYGSTHVIVAGKIDGLPVMLFHGVGDDSALMWLYNAKEWAEEFRLYAVDTIGGPGKSKPNSAYNESFDVARWVDEVREHLGLGKVNLIGVSHGGYLVQYYNLVRHEWVDKAISMASSVPDESSGSTMKKMMKVFFPEAFFPTNKNVKKLLHKMAGRNVGVFTENERIMTHYKWLLKGFNNMAMRYHKIKKFSVSEINVIRENTYYLIGEEDPFEKLGGKEALIQHKMKVRFFEETGHGINHEKAEEVNQLVHQIITNRINL
ncbi:MAG: alpha/beta fold hydrolase [Cellulosilyticum sp.]|nr:alpha/beta fold hydrolase [Cellulosilyticum sp.]